ncbi:MAG: phosphoribosylanthranilate isomerase [Chitinophagaceae bacterium]|nr:phosphoribosylanthranilate isomerase [Chitinophagaceae bacterium]
MSEQTTHIIPPKNFRIKVCGMTAYDQVMSLDEMGVVFAGFIFYAPSPRFCLRFTDLTGIKKIRGKNINKVGVFVNASAEEVVRTVDEAGLSMVQLHGEESPKTCERIAEYVSVIKAFRLREDDQVLWKIKDYQPLVDMILFDTATSTYGGSGKKFDWELLRGLKIGKPFFLSGGIGPEDAQRIHEFNRDPVAADLFAIDINSRFETSPGIKNISLIRQFMQELNPS